ncbi:MAG: hypothetical protein AYK19_18765 [Theionarchaea archaeon DG-70-1]|nr:MAG: hypothetical protein AYK19_18765 [Theionarchaea archaeon DG-70-1]
MTKVHNSDIHLLLSHILNKNPDILLDGILAQISEIKSRKVLKDTLFYMEKQQILMNPSLIMYNCENHTNRYLIAEVKNWNDLYRRIICKNYETIEAAYYIRSWKGNRLAFLWYHNTLEKEVQNVVEEGPIEYFRIIHPQSLTDRALASAWEMEPGKKSYILSEKLDKHLDWDYDTKQVFRWLNINYRLSLTEIARQIKTSRTTVRRKKEMIREAVHVYYPTFIHKYSSYSFILSSFLTEYPEFLLRVFENLSATSYLFGNQNRTLCYLATTLPGYLMRTLENLEERGVVEDLNAEITAKGWNQIEEEYKQGKTPEKFFWMFKRIKRKKSKL